MPLNSTDLAAIESEAAAMESTRPGKPARDRSGKYLTIQAPRRTLLMLRHLANIGYRKQQDELLRLLTLEYERMGIPLPPVE